MSEQKNALSLKVDIDTKEANESIRELTAAANECVEAFERLGDAITSVGALMNSSNAEEASRGDLINLMMKGEK
ncbi:hypothetical protein LAE98_13385 [Bacillus wiedmannii]|uniref:hypothetical protein n=1 Tax=Bacillus wiedmannii TaxID=1890302 RepID=UPI001CC11476|nr:hypothetical protein [Bacillus wiedmannii]MBZ4223056.1 hypothetical protein [Bacillus wiedmannii]